MLNRRTFLKAAGGGVAAAMAAHLARPWSAKAAAKGAATPSPRPNILLIMADDMGYSDAGCYGGDIDTPNLDALAEGGLRFTQHYSTARCWPSRACILTGYYAQHIRRDSVKGIKMGGRPPWAPLLPEYLKPLGYRAYHSGKWHIDGQPTQNGFDRSWGRERRGCDPNRYFASKRWKEDGAAAPVEPGEPYYSTVAVADHAIQCLKLHKAHHGGEPFFQYVAFFSPHFPLQALAKDVAKYRDAYTAGWDVIRKRRWTRMKEMGIVTCPLSERDPKIIPPWNFKPEQLEEQIGPGEAPYAVAWDSLSEEEKKFQAIKMAVHAAMIHRMDAEIGRIVRQLKDMGAFENTLIVFASDNGASAEQIIRGDGHDTSARPGGPKSFLCLGPGWSTASNTPFRLHKHWNHEGGISSPLIVHWPDGISARGELRHAPSHFIDFVPTAVELAGGKLPETYKGRNVPPKDGMSLVPVFQKDGALPERTLWWCHQGNRAIRVGDWKLCARRRTHDTWELYDLTNDRCEMNDLSDEHPEKVKALEEKWQAFVRGFCRDLKRK